MAKEKDIVINSLSELKEYIDSQEDGTMLSIDLRGDNYTEEDIDEVVTYDVNGQNIPINIPDDPEEGDEGFFVDAEPPEE